VPDNPHQKIYGLDEAQAFVKETFLLGLIFFKTLQIMGPILFRGVMFQVNARLPTQC
jgi:hypothetical protein